MVKKSPKTSEKSKNVKLPLTEKEKENLTPEIIDKEETQFSKISIIIESYQNIQPIYTSSNIFSACQYSDKELGKTNKIVLTDDPVNVINHQFSFHCNTNSLTEINRLACNPALITIIQSLFLNNNSKITFNNFFREESLTLPRSKSSVQSVVSLYEALTGDVVETADVKATKTNRESQEQKNKEKEKTSSDKLSKTSSKESKKSKLSFDKKKKKKVLDKEHSSQSSTTGDTLVGCCVVDLLPLIFGKTSFTEFVPIILAETFCDDRMTRYKFKPGLVVTVSIDKPIEFVCTPKILHVTFESIHNIPSVMNEEMMYHLCILLPSFSSAKYPLMIKNGSYTTTPVKAEQSKYWPEMPKTAFNRTHYPLDFNVESIKNYVENVNLQETLTSKQPRIEFNCIRRSVLFKDDFFAFYDQVRKYQKLILEIYAVKTLSNMVNSGGEKFKTETNKIVPGDQETKDKKNNYLHLMATIDLSPLMYPGVTKIRVAVPLTTFHEEEALSNGGLEKPYFSIPKPKTVTTVSDFVRNGDRKVNKKSRGNSRSTKKSKSSKNTEKETKNVKVDKSSRKSKLSKNIRRKKKKNEEDLDMKGALPIEPVTKPEPEPSIKIFNEHGDRTFIIVEIELTEPLIRKQNIDDLHKNLQEMLHQKPTEPKIIIDSDILIQDFQDKMTAIIVKISEEYVIYSKAKNQCHCRNKADFLSYLRRIGKYQNFVCVLTQAAVLLSQNKLNVIKESGNPEQYRKLVEEVFTHLNSDINRVLHRLTVMDQKSIMISINSEETILFYAKEAVEMGNFVLADRYYLEILYHDLKNADTWYEYAVYKTERNEKQEAFMCLQEGLKSKMFHKHSLLMNGILLAEKNQTEEAELCFLSLMVQESRWVEGWVVLYLFYKNLKNTGGMDLAEEMAMKYLNDPQLKSLNDEEDLTWSSSICPNTIFFRGSIILIKMRLFSWAEDALSFELKNAGVVHYLLAVICYYRRNYKHALLHLEKSRYFHGMDFSVASLTGHCYIALGNFSEAIRNYRYILESHETPDYAHLVYVNFAKVTTDVQEARKLFLIVCKHHPTPYTWMYCGSIYFKLNDLLSAQECFSEAVALDNNLPECWGYLTLINLKLRHTTEAELCYGLALKNNLRDEFLLQEIKNGFDKNI